MSRRMFHWHPLLFSVLLLLSASHVAVAQNAGSGNGSNMASPAAEMAKLPCHQANLLVPWRAGTGTDIIARLFVDAANAGGAKPPLRVVNREGDNGLVALDELRLAKADGCTLVIMSQRLLTAYFAGEITWDWKGVLPLALLTRTPMTLVIDGESKMRDLADWFAAVRAEPGKPHVAVERGSIDHFFFMTLARTRKTNLEYTFSDGAWSHISKVREGEAKGTVTSYAIARKYMKEGILKPIATTGRGVAKKLKGVRTFSGQGVRIEFGVDRGVFLPANTPANVISHYENIFSKAGRNPALIMGLQRHGVEVRYLNSDSYVKYHEDAFADWRELAIDGGLYGG